MSTQRIGGGWRPAVASLGFDWARPWPTRAGEDQLPRRASDALFVAPSVSLLDPSQRPELLAQIAVLRRFRGKLARLLGDDEHEYPMVLTDGDAVVIDADGQVLVGADFLAAHADSPAVLAGALARQIGRRPKQWRGRVFDLAVTRQDIEALRQEEEDRADAFMGAALAELDLDVEPAIAALTRGVHSEPGRPRGACVDGGSDVSSPDSASRSGDDERAHARAEIARDAHAGRTFRADLRRKIFPEVERMTSVAHHLGDG